MYHCIHHASVNKMFRFSKIQSGVPADVPDKEATFTAKIDGSQLTVVREGDALRFYNKGKPVAGTQNKCFAEAYISLVNQWALFSPDYVYHGEAVCSRQHNTVVYNRAPRYHWIVYEILRKDDNYMLSRDEMRQLLPDSIEIVDFLWVGPSVDLKAKVMDIIAAYPPTCLGGGFEGVVVRIPNKMINVQNKYHHTRRKMVAPEFQEAHHAKHARLGKVPADEFVQQLGREFATQARLAKAWQHYCERHDDAADVVPAVLAELDADLLDEHVGYIKDMLFSHFWRAISTAARPANTREYIMEKATKKAPDTKT